MIGGIADRWHWGLDELDRIDSEQLVWYGTLAAERAQREREAMKRRAR